MMFGEKECIYEQSQPVQIVAAAPNTRLVLISRKDLVKTLSPKETERMLVMSQLVFPNEKTVKQDVEVVKTVQRIKKNAFMDGVNMNQIARDMRPELIDGKSQKIRIWIDDVDVKVQRRLEERIKLMPAAESPLPIRESQLRRSATKEEQIKVDNSLRTLNDEIMI